MCTVSEARYHRHRKCASKARTQENGETHTMTKPKDEPATGPAHHAKLQSSSNRMMLHQRRTGSVPASMQESPLIWLRASAWLRRKHLEHLLGVCHRPYGRRWETERYPRPDDALHHRYAPVAVANIMNRLDACQLNIGRPFSNRLTITRSSRRAQRSGTSPQTFRITSFAIFSRLATTPEIGRAF